MAPSLDFANACPVPWVQGFGEPQTQPLQPMSVVRKCLLILVWHVLLLEIVLSSLLVLGMYFLPTVFLNPTTIVICAGAKLLIVLYLIVRWKTCYYLITPEKIIQHCGVFCRRQEACAIKNIESIILRQNLIGKLFHFGSLKLYAPTLNHRIFMTNIHNPRKRMRLIEKLTPKTQMQNLHKDDMVILPQQAQ